MKRTVICAALVATLAIPAAALAAKQAYFGELAGQPDSLVKVRTANNGEGQLVVRSFAVANFELTCAEGPATLRKSKLVGDVPIGNQGGFNVRDDNGETVFKVRGEIGGNRASGTFRYFGTIPNEAGSTSECDTERQSWSARAG